MKLLLGIALATFLMACEGPEGIPGPPGLDGLDGLDAPLPSVFQENVSFSFDIDSNTWFSNTLSYTGVADGDIFLVYISLGGGLYTPLPASFFDEFGEYQYVFDHDINSVELQIIGDSDLGGLDLASTENLPVRVAIMPANLIGQFSDSDLLNLDTVLEISGMSTEDIKVGVN
ncbi:MAG: hypothetical protein AAGF77_06855 [Bacteroidota bacterium]